ncbi:MAG TPA: ABC transporter permease [Candidatus Polarisedimenticolia bacterium]|nr:ABC transporter permease [Candidatus Polarisedimenticolia bacterium]
MRSLLRDLRYGVRLLFQHPGFTAVAVLTLGLGIGANTAIFSVVHAVLLQPLQYKDADRVMMIWEHNHVKGWTKFTASPAHFIDWQAQSKSFDPMVALLSSSMVLTGEGEPERIGVLKPTAGISELIGVPPVIGRAFRAGEWESGQEKVAILSDGIWKRRFGGKKEIIGQPITLGGESYTVIGIMPEGFRLPTGADLMMPLVFTPDERQMRGGHFLVVMARLKPGATLQAANSEMATIANAQAVQYPDSSKNWGAHVVPIYEEIVGDVRPALLSLFAAVGFVLLIACGNVTNLLLARGSARQKEIALRAALGAGRGRLIAQLLTESLLLSLVGGGLGLLLGQWGVELLRWLQPGDLPRMQNVGINTTVFLFTLGLSLLSGLIFGMAPAFLISHTGLQDTLKQGGRGTETGRHRLRNGLVVTQVAISLVLLVGAGLQVRSFVRVMQQETGLQPDGVMTLGVSLPEKKYPKPENQWTFARQALEKMQVLPGVKAAAATTLIPFGGNDTIYSIAIEGSSVESGDQPSANWYAVSPDYFKVLGIPLVKGRLFNERDDRTSVRVAVVNETFVKRLFPGVDPIGRKLRMGNDTDTVREIVGVVKDVKHYGLESKNTLQMYEPIAQIPQDTYTFILKTDGDPSQLTASARQVIFGLDKDQPVSDVSTMQDLIRASAAPRRFTTTLIGFFAMVALILAAVGIYGVVACSVAARTQEIGVRMALGAQRRDVLDMVLRQGMMLVLGGIVLGLGGAFALTRLISKLLFGVGALDALTYATTSLLLMGVALIACYFPARRAASVDPVTALHYE